MIKVLKFRLSFLKERLSIKGVKNNFFFALMVTAILIGGKAVVCCAGDYNMNSLFFTMICTMLCTEFIFPKNVDKNCHTVSIFFGNIDTSAYRYYLCYRGFWYCQILYSYLIFPINAAQVPAFGIAWLLMQTYILIAVLVQRYANSQGFSSFKWVGPILLGFLFLACRRSNLMKIDISAIDLKIWLLFLFIGLLEMMIAVKMLKVDAPVKSVHTFKHGLLPDIFLQNKDVLYVLRSDALIDPLVVTLFSGILSYVLNETLEDMIFTNMISFSYVFMEIYLKLLKYENKKHTLFYAGKSSKAFKKEKLRNTLLIAVPLSVVAAIPLSFITSPISVIVSLVISLLLFLVNTVFFKINLEKKTGYHIVISSRDEMQYILISSAGVLLICIMQSLMTGI